ncbi:MAG: saccharopine dehydrogenase NADP-binding domain-containing protein [Marinilabiliales bacterium]|nr:saccharopine dehydrogenase NADP-binding domain-containing protein [Marinilabiliales bacterium]
MHALRQGVAYLDTANYEPPEEAKFEYSWQWAYEDRYRESGTDSDTGLRL